MPVIVDTNVYIDAENNRLDLGSLKSLQTEVVYMAAITVSELLAGVKMAKTPDEQIQRHAFVENILNTIPVLDFDTEVARTYAELYSFALSQGQRSKLNVHDLQIAATALVHGYSILTANIDDFKNIPAIQLINPLNDVDQVHEDGAVYKK
jgi:predicted nucleic acid-binding protein